MGKRYYERSPEFFDDFYAQCEYGDVYRTCNHPEMGLRDEDGGICNCWDCPLGRSLHHDNSWDRTIMRREGFSGTSLWEDGEWILPYAMQKQHERNCDE